MLKVMLIDDEPFILEGLSVIIDWNKEGFEIVYKVQDAEEALVILKENQVDLIISDIKMPGMSGLDLIEKIKQEKLSDAYCVLLSGYSDFEYAKRAIKNKCLDYMLKPVDREELVGILEKVRLLKEDMQINDNKNNSLAQTILNFNVFETTNMEWTSTDYQIDKQLIDTLIRAVETNDREEINKLSVNLYQDFKDGEIRVINLAINYLLFELINLATTLDNSINQQEVLRFICDNSFEKNQMENDGSNMHRLLLEYSDYLVQLRGNQAQGVLSQVEQYLRENYMENITLKDLGKKYYINAAYLGQIFKKQYGESFKDYLNKIRIEKALELLLHTDKKIYEIAEEIGYKDLDYFINKFITLQGCTPTKFRKKVV